MAAYTKAVCLAAVLVAVLALVEAFPRPHPAGPAPIAPAKVEKSGDLKTDSSYGLGYYGGYGLYNGLYGGYGAYPSYGYGYGYPLGYSYSSYYGGYPYYG